MKPIISIIALILISLNAQADLNKWVDADGTVHYSDIVPPEVKKTETVRSVSGKGQVSAPVSNSTKSYAEREAEMKKTKQAKEEAAQKKELKEADLETKKRNCESAQGGLRALEEGARISTFAPNGERTYIDDAERAKQKELMQKAVSANCN